MALANSDSSRGGEGEREKSFLGSTNLKHDCHYLDHNQLDPALPFKFIYTNIVWLHRHPVILKPA